MTMQQEGAIWLLCFLLVALVAATSENPYISPRAGFRGGITAGLLVVALVELVTFICVTSGVGQ